MGQFPYPPESRPSLPNVPNWDHSFLLVQIHSCTHKFQVCEPQPRDKKTVLLGHQVHLKVNWFHLQSRSSTLQLPTLRANKRSVNTPLICGTSVQVERHDQQHRMHTSVDCLLTSKTEISVKSLRFSKCSHSKYQSIRKHDRYMVLTDVRQSADLMFLAKSGVALLAAGGPTRPRQKCPSFDDYPEFLRSHEIQSTVQF